MLQILGVCEIVKVATVTVETLRRSLTSQDMKSCLSSVDFAEDDSGVPDNCFTERDEENVNQLMGSVRALVSVVMVRMTTVVVWVRAVMVVVVSSGGVEFRHDFEPSDTEYGGAAA